MATAQKSNAVMDPVEIITQSITSAWEALCKTYTVTASQPKLHSLFRGVELGYPDQAAETVLVNMLLELIEAIDRFSPWYGKPARTFGLVSMRNPTTGRQRWILAPEGCQRYHQLLNPMMDAIDLTRGVLRAILLVESRMESLLHEDTQVILECECDPPHAIQVRRSIKDTVEIVCDDCRMPYA